jgi:hypothetical protein
MARRKAGLAGTKASTQELLDYHEGLSINQVKIILCEFGLGDKYKQFSEWMYGQTCPIIKRGGEYDVWKSVGGVYEYDLFRWIENQKKGTPLIWD